MPTSHCISLHTDTHYTKCLKMASKSSASIALFLALNLLFFSLVTANECGCKPTPTPKPKPKPTPSPSPYIPTPSPPMTKPTPTPSPPTPTPTPSGGKCPRDALNLGACANLLGLVNVVVGSSQTLPCCSLLEGLTDLEVALCLCTAIKANVLGINLNVLISLSLIVNACGKQVPSGFKCE